MNYKEQKFEDVVKNFDVVLDTVAQAVRILLFVTCILYNVQQLLLAKVYS